MTEVVERPSPSRARLYAILSASLLASTVILLGFVLPAEFGVDPTGFGRASGLLRLSQPAGGNEIGSAPTSAVRSDGRNLQTDVIEIPLAAAGDPDHLDQREWKLGLHAGDTLVYGWQVDAPPEEFYFDFHAEGRAGSEAGEASFGKGTETSGSGAVTAGFDGHHGWYFQNQSEQPVVVRVSLAGFYELLAEYPER